jgi:hypothetical protein
MFKLNCINVSYWWSFTFATITWLTGIEYICHKWPRICSTCRKHFPVLSLFMTNTWSITRLTRRVAIVEQELLTLLEIVLCSFVLFSFGQSVVCSFSICGFRLPLWYLLSRYICYGNLNFLANVFIIKTNVRLPQALVTLTDFDYTV